MQPQKQKVMKLLLVRHGETEDNKTRTIAGHRPGKLTPLGKTQAQCIGKFLSKHKRTFDHIYVSDLGRTRQTFEGACSKYPQLKNMATTFTPIVRERCGGVLQGKPIITWQENAKKESLHIRKYKCEGGENWIDVNKRATKFLQQIIRSHLNPDGKQQEKILVVTHGGFIMEFLNVMDRVQKKALKFDNSAKNCSMYQFDIIYPQQFYQYKEFMEDEIKAECTVKNFVGHLTG